MDEQRSADAATKVTIDLSELDLAPDWVSRAGEAGGSQVVWEVTRDHDRGRGGRAHERDRRREGGPPPGDRRERAGRRERGPRRDDARAREFSPREARERGRGRQEVRGPGTFGHRRPSGDQRGEPRGDRHHERGGEWRGDSRSRAERDSRDHEPATPPGWEAMVLPEPAGIESLSVQLKATGRSYAVFDVARLFLARNERFRVRFGPRHDPKPPVLILCAIDGSLWLSRDEARRHFARAGLLTKFFTEDKVPVDPPKGIFTAIAVCGLSGTVLGPPNLHAYQRNVIRLHQERFRNMPLERFKSRIRIERDEEAVRKWIEEQSTRTQYKLIGGDSEAPTFTSAEEAQQFVFETRENEILAEAPVATVPGTLDRGLLSPGLFTLMRHAVEQQRRFPIQLVHELCRQFEHAGLRFFKENKRETYVSRSRPRPLDPGMAVSDRVRAIIDCIRSHAGCTYRDVVRTLAPQAAGLIEGKPPARSVGVPPMSQQDAGEQPAESQTEAVTEGPEAATAAPNETNTEPQPAPPTAATEQPSEADREGLAVLQDLRWLIREGFVTEFSDGRLRVVERSERPIVLNQRRLRLPGRGFTLWTQAYRGSTRRRLRLPGCAFTIWTAACGRPSKQPRLLALPGAGFTVWTHSLQAAPPPGAGPAVGAGYDGSP
jgi:hypothetical protein